MGKSYNRNQDKYNKFDRERQKRDKKNKFKHGKKQLTPYGEGDDSVGVDMMVED